MSLALAATAVLFGVSALAKMACFHIEGRRMRGIALRARSDVDPNGLQQRLSEARKTADRLKQKNLLIQAPPRTHPVKQVDGILGDEALIAGKWYKAGAKIGDAKILAVKPTEVQIEWDGKETAFAPMAAKAGPPGGPPVPEPPKGTGPEPPKPPPVQVTKAEAPPPAAEDPLAWMGISLSPELREKLLAHWNKASDAEKAEAQEKWNNMSEEEKEKTLEGMERM